MWGLYADYSRSAEEHRCAMWGHASNVKCMYTNASIHIIDCSEFR